MARHARIAIDHMRQKPDMAYGELAVGNIMQRFLQGDTRQRKMLVASVKALVPEISNPEVRRTTTKAVAKLEHFGFAVTPELLGEALDDLYARDGYEWFQPHGYTGGGLLRAVHDAAREAAAKRKTEYEAQCAADPEGAGFGVYDHHTDPAENFLHMGYGFQLEEVAIFAARALENILRLGWAN